MRHYLEGGHENGAFGKVQSISIRAIINFTEE
jgi:hypothetical protein